MKRYRLTRVAPAAAVLVLAAAPAVWAAGNAAGVSRQDPERGRSIFQGKGSCFTCHGREGGGTPLGPDLTDGEWVNFQQPPAPTEVVALVKTGVAKPVRHPAPMPPMGGARLSEEEIADVAAYVLSLSPQPDGG